MTGTPKEGNRELRTGTQTASSGHIVPTRHSFADLNSLKRELVLLATDGGTPAEPLQVATKVVMRKKRA
jgi:hypothetical protein